MRTRPGSRRSRYGRLLLAALPLVALTACSKPGVPPTQQGSAPAPAPAATTTAVVLTTELPEPYRSWPRGGAVTACSFDAIASKPGGDRGLSGWGIINASTGEVPEAFVLEIQKDGKTSYLATTPAERKDVPQRLGNPALAKSGFTVVLPAAAIKAPFTASMLLAFQGKLFPCEYKVVAE